MGSNFPAIRQRQRSAKKFGTKIEDKIYVAVEEAGEIAVISAKDRTVIKRIDLSPNRRLASILARGMKIGFMPHNVQVAPDNKTVWVTANAMDMSNDKVSFSKFCESKPMKGMARKRE